MIMQEQQAHNQQEEEEVQKLELVAKAVMESA